jgi:hypothetical protein
MEMRSRLIASGARCSQWVSSSCLLLGFHVIAQVAAWHANARSTRSDLLRLTVRLNTPAFLGQKGISVLQ